MAPGTVPISIGSTVDIGYGRGRLAPNPAASLRRIDAQLRAAGLGDYADVNDAWRSPEQADANRAAWIRYQNGGPIAPYALDRWGSIHCRGYAKDSDDWYNSAKAAIFRRNGWRQTALYPVGDSRREPWHGEYDEALDLYLGTAAGSGSTPFPTDPSTPSNPTEEDTDMRTIHSPNRPWANVGPGYLRHISDEAAANTIWPKIELNDRQYDLAVEGASAPLTTRPVGGMVIISDDAGQRPPALVGPGYYRALNAEEVDNVGTLADRRVVGNTRQYDLWVSIALAGQGASFPIASAALGALSDADVNRLAVAFADEQARRLAE